MKKTFQLISVILIVSAAALILAACGGGGGDGGSKSSSNIPEIEAPPAGTMATLDQNSGQSIVALSMFGQEVSGVSGLSGTIFSVSADSEPAESSITYLWAVVDYIKAELATPTLAYQPTGSNSGPVQCDGGKGSADLSWTGPQAVTSFCQIVDLSGQIVFSSCNIGGTIATGTIDVNFTGPLCQPTAIYMDLTNVVMSTDQDSMKTRSLEMDITNISWSGDMTSGGFMTNARMVANGDTIGSSDGVDYAAVLDDYTQVITTHNDRDLTIAISGNIYGTCIDGWAAIETIAPIQVNISADCPTAGEFEISGQNQSTMSVVFEPNQVTIDGTAYPSCTALDQGCPLL